MTTSTKANHRRQHLFLEYNHTLPGIAEQKNTEEEQAIRAIVDGIELLDDISEWFGLTNKQQHELLSNDMIGSSLTPMEHALASKYQRENLTGHRRLVPSTITRIEWQ